MSTMPPMIWAGYVADRESGSFLPEISDLPVSPNASINAPPTSDSIADAGIPLVSEPLPKRPILDNRDIRLSSLRVRLVKQEQAHSLWLRVVDRRGTADKSTDTPIVFWNSEIWNLYLRLKCRAAEVAELGIYNIQSAAL